MLDDITHKGYLNLSVSSSNKEAFLGLGGWKVVLVLILLLSDEKAKGLNSGSVLLLCIKYTLGVDLYG